MKIETKKQKKRQSPLLPIMGLVIAVALGILAYFLAPILVDLLKDLMGPQKFNQRLGGFPRQNLDYAFTVVLWLLLFSLSMLIVSVSIGEDPAKEEHLVKPPPHASPKEWKHYFKQLEKLEAKRVKQAEEKQRKIEKR